MSDMPQGPEPDVAPDFPAATGTKEGGPTPLGDARSAALVLVAALGIGLLGDALMHTNTPGVGWLLWLGVLLGVVALLRRRLDVTASGGWRWLGGVALLLGAGFSWRDAPMLRELDLFATLLVLSIPSWHPLDASLGRLPLRAGLGGSIVALVDAGLGAYRLIGTDVRWSEPSTVSGLRHVLAFLVGLAIAVPILLLFGALFTSADPRFGTVLQAMLPLRPDQVVAHGMVAALLTWTVGGYLRGVVLRGPRGAVPAPVAPFLGVIEVATVLVLLDALFAVFVAIQLPYLFGGSERVLATAGMTYATYARRGFFELVAVTALVLPLLIALHVLMRPTRLRAVMWFRVLAGTLLVLVMLVVASAAQRMGVYQSVYGLTVLRVNVLAFECWLAVALALFGVTVLLGRADRFAFALMAWGVIGTLGMHLPDLEGDIVRHNVAIAHQGRSIDLGYLAELSADAAPALVDAALGSGLEPAARAELARGLLSRYAGDATADWREWRVSRAAACRKVLTHRSALEAVAGTVSGGTIVPVVPGKQSR